ncbi:hypothetical protein DFH11DRAFT_1547775 [Phellopilus nigrolimitatus]|nr:hypothetical protein DFH11DRAFT_1547775 [Phellopilus nigrolimitatus]
MSLLQTKHFPYRQTFNTFALFGQISILEQFTIKVLSPLRMKREYAERDQEELDKYPEKNCEETIYIAVSRGENLHWRLVWRAYDTEGNFQGWRVVEIKHDLSDQQNKTFTFRYSFRSKYSSTIRIWEMISLGTLDLKKRKELVFWAWDAHNNPTRGNCISCVWTVVKEFAEESFFDRELAMRSLEETKRKDLLVKEPGSDEPRWFVEHSIAHYALEQNAIEEEQARARIGKRS